MDTFKNLVSSIQYFSILIDILIDTFNLISKTGSYFAAGCRPHRVEYILTFSAFPLMAQWNSQRFHSRASWNHLKERGCEYIHMNNHAACAAACAAACGKV